MRTIAFTLTMLMSSGPLLASTNLLEIWQTSRQSDTNLAGANIQHEIAKTQVNQGLGMLLPSVRASAGYEVSGPDFDIDWADETLSYGITLAQPVYHQNAIYYYNGFKERAEGRGYSVMASEQSLMLNVVDHYFNVLKAQDTVTLSEAELRAVERQLEQTEKHYDVGLVAITDVLDARASHIGSKVNLITAQGNYANALQALSVLTGRVTNEVAALPEILKIDAANELDVQHWLDLADESHPSLIAERQNLKFLRLSKKATASDRLPTVDASYTYGYDSIRDTTSRFQIGVSLPIFSGGQTSAKIIEAGLNLNAAEQGYEQLRRNVELNIRLIHRKLSTDRLNLEAQEQAVKSRESALKATEVGYEVGTRNIVEVLNAQRALFASKLQHRMAQYSLLIGNLQLKQAAGSLAEDDLVKLNEMLVK